VTRAPALRLALWILIGAGLRFAFLGGDGLWLDEGYTAWTVDLSASQHRSAVANDDAPPLYYGVQRLVTPALPRNEVSLRILSGAASVAGICWLAILPPSAIAAEAMTAFFAIGSYGVAYGRQARSYALLLLWEILLLTATARVCQGRRRWLIVVALSEGLALWTHNVAATLVIGANLAWFLCCRRDARGWIAAQAAAFLMWLPYLARMIGQFRMHAVENHWIVEYWHKAPLILAAPLSLGYMAAGARVWPPPPTRHWFYAGPGSIVLTFLTLAAVATLLVAAFRRTTRREAVFAASFTLGPLLSLEILSFVTKPSYVLGRTDAVAYAGFLLWCALGLRSLPRPARWGTAGVLALCTTLTLATNLPYGSNIRDNDRKVGRQIRADARPGDWIAFVGLSRPSIDYYVSGARPGRPDPSIKRLDYPAGFGRNPSATYPTPGESLRVWEQEAYHVRERFEREGAPGSRIFFVGPVQPAARRDLTAEDVPYPGSLLAYVLNGTRPIRMIARLRGDGIGVDWLAFSVPRDSLVARDELQPVEGRP